MADVPHRSIREIATTKGATTGRVDPAVDNCGACNLPKRFCRCDQATVSRLATSEGLTRKPAPFTITEHGGT